MQVVTSVIRSLTGLAIHVALQATHRSLFDHHVRSIYCSLRPHTALSPPPIDQDTTREQQANEVAWSQLLVNNVLPLVLPPEDLDNPCLHVLVSEIFAEMIVRNGICGKACESWLLWEGVTKLIYFLRPDIKPSSHPDANMSPINRLEQFGLLTNLERTASHSHSSVFSNNLDVITFAFWSMLQSVLLTWLLLRTFVTSIWQASALPHRSSQAWYDESAVTLNSPRLPDNVNELDFSLSEAHRTDTGLIPIVDMTFWSCLTRLSLLEQRMPWLTGLLSLLHWLSTHGPGQVCGTNSRLDR